MDKVNKNGWFTKLMHKKWLVPAGLGLGVMLLVIGNTEVGAPAAEDSQYVVQYYTAMLEERIADLCKSVSGVTEASVLLTLDSGSEYVYARNAANAGSASEAWDYVIITQGEGEKPVMLSEIYPKVRGVAVVCTGGNSAKIQQIITELLTASLGISSNRIKVAGM